MNKFAKLIMLFLATGSALLSGGCATTGNGGPGHASDPLEGFNRGVYAFNRDMDKIFLKPVAEVYDAVLPEPVDQGVTNFLSNLNDVMSGLNNLLQFKFEDAGQDAGRFLLNSTVGFLGFFDVASEYGLEKHNEDFGQTLGYWGVGSGPYLVLPLFGPTTLRDGVGMGVDGMSDPITYVEHVPTRNTVRALGVLNARADLLDKERILDAAATDEYSFVRDAYLQRREALVRDGEVDTSQKISDEELFDDLEPNGE